MQMIKTLCLGAAALVLSGCASLNNLSSEVSTFGPWPAERKPASFVFERLPSQQSHPERQQQLEDSARGALEAAGFRPTADAANAEYLLQVGARVSSTDPWLYNDSLFWRAGWRHGYYGPGFGRWGRGPYWGVYGSAFYPDSGTFEREVALLIRDRKTGQLLYEARAANSGPSPSIDQLLPAMFAAAMKDFPGTGPNPRQVTTQVSAVRP
jgi:hypothetical protein